MRQIIFEGSGPHLVFSTSGQLQVLRTGSDGYAEHTDPIEYLLPKLCPGVPKSEEIEVHPITQGQLLEYVALPTDGDSPPEAVIGYNGPAGPWFNGTETRPLDHRYVLSNLTAFHGDAAAAMAWGNFAIRVRGAANVAALADFHAAALAGDVALVIGSRYRGNPYGIALINLKALSEEELIALKADTRGFLKSAFAFNQV